MTKKQIEEYLEEFYKGTGLKVSNNNEHVLSSKYGDIKVTFRLDGKLPTVFTKLIGASGLFNQFEEFKPFGYNSNTGKNSYFGDDVYHFLHSVIVTADLLKSDSAITARITRSMFAKSPENKQVDIAIYKGSEMIESVICIGYMEALKTSLNLSPGRMIVSAK